VVNSCLVRAILLVVDPASVGVLFRCFDSAKTDIITGIKDSCLVFAVLLGNVLNDGMHFVPNAV